MKSPNQEYSPFVVVSLIGLTVLAAAIYGPARSLSEHPLLAAISVAAALKWKFEPIEVSGKPTNVVGTVAFNFKLTEKI